jgi:methylenetetrahydrofolate dehydrogenase (NADP+)/methenyltetrahydrofolate cyclohydrolase
MRLLSVYGIETAGKHAVVIGRSNIVGKPVAQLLLAANATVTLCHSKTADLPGVARTADILVAAIGKPRFVDKSFIKTGAVVIDVGMNRSDGKLCGDVSFDEVFPMVSAITPVPKGVGPMTIAMLLENTYEANVSRQTL